jgi:allantoicase
MPSPTFEPVELDDFDKVLGTTSTEVSSVALGGKILGCSDEWFAPASDLLKVRLGSIEKRATMMVLI